MAGTHAHLRQALMIVYSMVTFPFLLTNIILILLQYQMTMCSGRWIPVDSPIAPKDKSFLICINHGTLIPLPVTSLGMSIGPNLI